MANTNTSFAIESANVIGAVVIKKMLNDRFSRIVSTAVEKDKVKATKAVTLEAVRNVAAYDDQTEQAAVALLSALPKLKDMIPEWFEELHKQRVEWIEKGTKTRAEF